MISGKTLIKMEEMEFRLLNDLINDYCGLYFTDGRLEILQSRLQNRLHFYNFNSFLEYYHFIKYDADREKELKELIDVLTNNETYFFREKKQLEAFSRTVLRELRERKLRDGNRVLRIWSAGCSSGEEPYTISMLLLEDKSFLSDWKVEIIGIDINERVLEIARKGIYYANSFRRTDNYYIDKYFDKQKEGYKIRDIVRKNVSYTWLNLLEHQRLCQLGQPDLIFFRNVMIYWSEKARKKTVDCFFKCIKDRGYLFLGHSESLYKITNIFELIQINDALVYKKETRR